MRQTRRTVWGLTCGLLLIAAGAHAGTYSARVRWQSSTDPEVVGYRVHTRLSTGGYGTPREAGMPTPAGDGSLGFTISNLTVQSDYAFAVTAYTADDMESGLSNESSLGYAQVAPLVDSDGDGLTDAEEDRNLNRVVDAGESSPDDPDTDRDAIGDPIDVCQGTLPGATVNTAGCSCAQISCDNGNACDGVESCSAGVCGPGTPPVCDDGDACTVDSCSPASGCTNTPMPSCGGGSECATNADCNDGNPCTTDSCHAGACLNANNTAPCADDGNSCTADVCAAGSCTHPARADGTTCSDGLFCTVGDSCRAGVCGSGGPNCADRTTDCRVGACDEARDVCTTTPMPDGTDCGDGDTCNGEEACSAGFCTSTGEAPCDDGNPCTADACSAGGGCTHEPVANGAPCDDRLFCNGAETCQEGVCAPSDAPVCDDGDPCTVDRCIDRRRRCVHEETTECGECTTDVDCADTDACTTNERCERGACVRDDLPCRSEGPCTFASCDPVTGCTLNDLPEGSSCEDGDPCTTGEACRSGLCIVPITPRPALTDADATGHDLTVKRFVLRSLGERGTRLIAKGRFAGVSIDPGTQDVTIDVRDPHGYEIYTTTVPGSELVIDRGGTRFLYWRRKGTPTPFNGLERLLLELTGDTIKVVAKAIIAPEDGQTAPMLARGAARRGGKKKDQSTEDDQLAWAVKVGDQCVSDPRLDCTKGWRRRRCR